MTTRETVTNGRTLAKNARNSLHGAKGAACAFAITMIAGTSTGLAQMGELFDDSQPDIRNALGGGDVLVNGQVNVNEHDIVDLHVQGEDLAMVLQMLSIQTEKNIITGKDVSATVTANLYGVTFYEALDAILHANGYGYIEQGNFITIYTQEELIKFQEASRVKTAKIIRLNYINSVDAAAFVQALLSPEGTITTNGIAEDFSVNDDSPGGANSFASEATMVIIDWEENVSAIQELILQLDTKPVQVLVEAVVLHTTLTEENAWGVDVSVLGNLALDDFIPIGGVVNAIDGLLTGNGSGSVVRGNGPSTATLQSTGGRGPGTLKFGLVSGDVSAFVRMLDQISDTKIVSKPNILTLNRQSARVLVGRKVGYLSTTATQTSTTETVEFLDTGTQLYFRPFVSTDGMIRMELKPQISEAVIREATDATGAAVTIPDEITNEITTNVLVRDGQTIVLGGLFRESTTATRRQVPFLGDMPFVGAAFRGNDDLTERTEIIFMVTPSIMNDTELIAQGERASRKVRQVRSGFRAGLLPWSREKMTSKLLVEAQRLATEGKTQSALNKVGRSLSLSPYQPEAIALREALMGKEAVWPRRNMLHDIVSGETEAFLESLGSAERSDQGASNNNVQIPDVQPASTTTFQNDDPNFPFVETPQPNDEFSNEQFGTLNEMTESAETPTTGVFNEDSEMDEDSPDLDNQDPEFISPHVEEFQPYNTETDTPSEVEAPTEQPAEPTVLDDGRRDFDFYDEDIQAALRTIASEFHENVIFAQDVTGKVTAQLYGVTFDEALGAIVLANGYVTIDRGSYLEVRAPEAVAPVPAIASTNSPEVALDQGSNSESPSSSPWDMPVQTEASTPEAPAESHEFDAQTDTHNFDSPETQASVEQDESIPSPFIAIDDNSNAPVNPQPADAEIQVSTNDLDSLFESAASDRFWGDVFLIGWNATSSHVRMGEAGPVSVDPSAEEMWFDYEGDPYRQYWETPIVEVDEDGNPNR